MAAPFSTAAKIIYTTQAVIFKPLVKEARRRGESPPGFGMIAAMFLVARVNREQYGGLRGEAAPTVARFDSRCESPGYVS